jgi:hypothetical protein
MADYGSIETAARHRDWQECARIMFRLLYRCRSSEQRKTAAAALKRYVPIWKSKHPEPIGSIPDLILSSISARRRPILPEFPEDLDPADAEFENGIIEFYNGSISHTAQRTAHFATAIRSAVLAHQIDMWLREHPDAYSAWKTGQGFQGPTFLQDDAAAGEAELMWKSVADLLRRCSVRSLPLLSKRVERAYKEWEEAIP